MVLAVVWAAWLSPVAAQAQGGSGTFTDTRDGKTYRTVKIGEQTWMAENLNYKPLPGKTWCYENDTSYCKTWTAQILNYAKPSTPRSWCYNDSDSYCEKYGRLYDWNTARTACPAGWHLPSSQEWNILIKTSGGSSVAAKTLKSTSGWYRYNGKSGNGTDDFGFSALPVPSRSSNGVFYNAGSHGSWWTATENRTPLPWLIKWYPPGHAAYFQTMHYTNGNMGEGYIGKDHAYSVRCVQGVLAETRDTLPEAFDTPARKMDWKGDWKGSIEDLLFGGLLPNNPYPRSKAPALKERPKPTTEEYCIYSRPRSYTGSRGRASIQRVIMQNMAPLRRAYDKRLSEKPGLSGKVTVWFAIDEFGNVNFSTLVESTMKDTEFENTVVNAVKGWKFDKIDKPGDIQEVTYPFVFAP
jgi:TonB family protein